MKFSGTVGNGPVNKSLNFAADTGHSLESSKYSSGGARISTHHYFDLARPDLVPPLEYSLKRLCWLSGERYFVVPPYKDFGPGCLPTCSAGKSQ